MISTDTLRRLSHQRAAFNRIELVKAGEFSLAELTEAYNQTRIDYIVPMPMNVSRLREYIRLYDVDLNASWVAWKNKVILGLGMLGVRRNRAWITRVGVLPSGRRKGIGRAIIEKLLESAAKRNLQDVWLEVIEGNLPAHNLFLTSGFRKTRDLIVARRPPIPEFCPNNQNQSIINSTRIREVDHTEALALFSSRVTRPNWLNEIESLANMDRLHTIVAECGNGDQGWICFQDKPLLLNHVLVETIHGDPAKVTASLLQILHSQYKTKDAIMENLPATDPSWRGFRETGYFNVFHRIEMVNKNITGL